jgi:nicotinamidase-related amidase
MAEEFPIVPEKTALLFFDTLNGGLHPLNNPEAAAKIEASGYIGLLKQIEVACRDAGIAIFYTLPEHRQDGKDWGITVVGDPEAPKLTTFAGTNYKGSYHATVIPEIEPQEGDYVVTKHRWNSFHQTHLELSLRTAGIDTIILVGGATQVGIASTAYGARDRDFNLIILSDACRSNMEGVNEYFMENIFPRFARVMTVAEAIEKIAVPAAV